MDELAIRNQARTLDRQAQAYQIETNEDYSEAAEFLRRVKGAEREVKTYWKPAKDAAAKAHKEICAKERAMLCVCESAESTLKQKMLTYSTKIEAERRTAEEAARKAAKMEADRLLSEAASAEKAGNAVKADASMLMAEQVDSMQPSIKVNAPTASGISTKKVWQVRFADTKVVPAYVRGICVRPIDETALLHLHKLDPNISIPGVQFVQVKHIAVR